jgi:hypothetical protein
MGEWTSALVGRELSASRLGCFASGTHWVGGWVGFRTGLDDVPLPGLEFRPLGLPARSHSLYRLSYPGSKKIPLQYKCDDLNIIIGAGGSVVGRGTMLLAGRLRVRFPMRLLDFFSWPNASSHTVALGSTQPVTEMNTKNLPGGKGRPACKADNLTAICEPTV